MGRKETLVTAVLVNGAMLVSLFVSAVKYGNHEEKGQTHTVAITEPLLLVEGAQFQQVRDPEKIKDESLATLQGHDVVSHTKTHQELATPSEPLSGSSNLDFVKELEAIASASLQREGERKHFEGSLQRHQNHQELPDREISVTVKKGDVLAKIAKEHHVTVAQIMTHNHLPNTMLRIGQVLKIPQKQTTQKQGVQPVEQNTPKMDRKHYVVKTGDTPWSIAIAHQMKVEELLRLNNMTAEKARRLKPGDQLVVR